MIASDANVCVGVRVDGDQQGRLSILKLMENCILAMVVIFK